MANTDFSVLLKAMLDTSGMNAELKQVQEIVNKYSIEIMPELKTASLKNQMKSVSKDIANDFNKAFGTNLTGADVFKAFENQAKASAESAKKASKAQTELIESMAKAREQSELSRREEEKRQQQAQNNAINKALDEEYKRRQKNIEATQKQSEAMKKQEEADRKFASEYTKNASRKLSDAVNKYSHGNSANANKMIKQMNRGVSNFGNLENVGKTAKYLDGVIDNIIEGLKKSHSEALKSINEQLKAEQQLQELREKSAYNGIDESIEKRAKESKRFAENLKQQMQESYQIEQLANGGVKNDYSIQVAKLQGDFRGLGLAEDEVIQKTQKVSSAVQVLQAEFNKPISERNFDAIKTANDTVQRELLETSNEYTKLKAQAKGYATEQQRLTMANTIEAWNQKNTAATKVVIEQNNKYIESLRNLDETIDKIEFNKIKNGFKEAENSMRGLGKLGASFRNQMQQAASSFTTWLSASTAVMTVISKTRDAITELKEVDTLLTEISKANDNLSKSQLTGIGDRSFETASKYGLKATNYLAGVQEMSRAGYQNAEAMAELSVKAQGAGDMTEDVANKFIVATDKAYKLNGSLSELTKIMDGINYITNHNAINMTELSEGFSIVGSTAASFGVEANELTAALATMGASTQQSGSEVARAFRAILLNIRQVSDEEEGIDAEGLTKYEEACNDLGVTLKKTVNGVQELRDPMEVLGELSKKYKELSDTDIKKVNLLNSVGGKLRATQLDALLRGWDDYQKMLSQFEAGTGSMQREAEKTADSWEGSMNRLSNTWTDTIGNIANSSAVKILLEALNGILAVINGITSILGTFGTVGLTTLAMLAKNGITLESVFSTITGGAKTIVLKYARHTVVVTLNKLMMNMVSLTRLYVANA